MSDVDRGSYLMGYLAATRPELVRLREAFSAYGDVLDGDAREVFKRVSWSLREAEQLLDYVDTLTDPDTLDRSRTIAAHLLEVALHHS